jgi:hypothetical protein
MRDPIRVCFLQLTLVMIPLLHALKVENPGIIEVLAWEDDIV